MLTPYPTYKDSGVPWLGRVPEHWKIVPGFSAFQEKFLKNTGMIEQTVLSLSYGRLVVKPAHKLHGLVPESFETYQIVDPGEIIIRPTDLQNDWNSLRVGIARNRGIITSAYICLRTLGNVLPDYGYLVLHAYDLMKVFYGMGSGLRQNLDFKDLKRMPVAIPTIEEQRQIVKFLNFETALIARFIRSKQRMIALLKEQKQAIINQAVTGQINVSVRDFNANDATGATDASVQRPYPAYKPSGVAWLGDILAHWEVRRVKYASEILRGRFNHRPRTDPQFYNGSYPFIQTGDVAQANKHITTYKQTLNEKGLSISKQFPSGTLVMTIAANIGDVAILQFDACLPDSIVGFIPKKNISLEYLYYLFASMKSELLKEAPVNTQGNLNIERIGGLPIPIPSYDEQIKIVSFIENDCLSINNTIAHIEREIALMQEYRARLIADVVTGQLDVRGVAVPDVAEEADEEDLNIEEDTDNNITQEPL